MKYSVLVMLLVLSIAPVFSGAALGYSKTSSRVIHFSEDWSLSPDGVITRKTSRTCCLHEADLKTTGVYRFSSTWKGAVVQVVSARQGNSLESLEQIDSSLITVSRGEEGTNVTIDFQQGSQGAYVSTVIKEIYNKNMFPGHIGFAPSHIFSSSLPAERYSFSVSVPLDISLTYIARRMGSQSIPQVTISGKVRTYEWVQRTLPVTRKEPLMPSLSNAAPVVRTTVAKDWGVISRWMGGALSRHMEVSPKVRGIADRIRKSEGFPSMLERQKIQAALSSVRERIRYVDLPMGVFSEINGHGCDEILSRGYGDCVDFSILLSAVLKALNIEAMPVFVASQDVFPIEPELPTPYCGDHCVVKIGRRGDSLFVDPVSSDSMAGDLPVMYADQICFSPLTEEFYRTPGLKAADHGFDTEQRYFLKADRSLAGTFSVKAFGHEGRLLNAAMKKLGTGSPLFERILKKVLGLPSRAFLKANDCSLPRQGETSSGGAFEVAGNCSVPEALIVRPSDNSGELLLPGGISTASELLSEERTFPILYRNPVSHRARVAVTSEILNVTFVVPKKASFASSCADYTMTATGNCGSLIRESLYRRKEREVAPSQYADYRQMMSHRAAVERRAVLVTLPEEVSKASLHVSPLSKQTFSSRLKGKESAALPMGKAVVKLFECAIEEKDDGSVEVEEQSVVHLKKGAHREFFHISVPLPPGAEVKRFAGGTMISSSREVYPFSSSLGKGVDTTVLTGTFSSPDSDCVVKWVCRYVVPPTFKGSFLYKAGLRFSLESPSVLVEKYDCEVRSPSKSSFVIEKLAGNALRSTSYSLSQNMKGKRISGRSVAAESVDFLVGPELFWKDVARSMVNSLHKDLAARLPGKMPSVKNYASDSLEEQWRELVVLIGKEEFKQFSHIQKAYVLYGMMKNRGFSPQLYALRKSSEDSLVSRPSQQGFHYGLVRMQGQWFSPDETTRGSSPFARRFVGGQLLPLTSLRLTDDARDIELEEFLPQNLSYTSRLIEEISGNLDSHGNISLKVHRLVEGAMAQELSTLLRASNIRFESSIAEKVGRVFRGGLVSKVHFSISSEKTSKKEEPVLEVSFEVYIPEYSIADSKGVYRFDVPYLPVSGFAAYAGISRRTVIHLPCDYRVLGVNSSKSSLAGCYERTQMLGSGTVLWEQQLVPSALKGDEQKSGSEKEFVSPSIEYLKSGSV